MCPAMALPSNATPSATTSCSSTSTTRSPNAAAISSRVFWFVSLCDNQHHPHNHSHEGQNLTGSKNIWWTNKQCNTRQRHSNSSDESWQRHWGQPRWLRKVSFSMQRWMDWTKRANVKANMRTGLTANIDYIMSRSSDAHDSASNRHGKDLWPVQPSSAIDEAIYIKNVSHSPHVDKIQKKILRWYSQ